MDKNSLIHMIILRVKELYPAAYPVRYTRSELEKLSPAELTRILNRLNKES